MSARWYWKYGTNIYGPIDSAELRRLATDGSITPSTPVRKEGHESWFPASRIKNLFPNQGTTREETRDADSSSNEKVFKPTEAVINAAKSHASEVLSEIRSLNFKEEVLPVNERVIKKLLKDRVFLIVLILGSAPLFITGWNNTSQLAAFSLYFSVLWGIVFKSFVIPIPGQWTLLIGSFLFTSLIGISLLRIVNIFIAPGLYLTLRSASSIVTLLPGMVLFVGIPEELCKALPVLAYLRWKGENADPILAVLIGVFSGLGFAAIENVGYGHRFSYLPASAAMSAAMLRVVSASFCHAVFAGTSAYFLSIATLIGRRRATLLVVGVLVAAVLHGVYNTLSTVGSSLAAIWVVASVVLFYCYLTKLRTFYEIPQYE